MIRAPLPPLRTEVPTGFVDAMGLDDESIAIKPILLVEVEDEEVAPAASSAPARLPARAAAMGK